MRERLAGLKLSTSSCRRLTERLGQELQERHRGGETFVPPKPASWDLRLLDDKGQRVSEQVLYVGVDAFAVPTRIHAGLTTAWKMMYVGLLYDPVKEHTVYLSDYDLDQLAASLRRYAVALGLGGHFLGIVPAMDAVHYLTMLLLDRARLVGMPADKARQNAAHHAEHPLYDFAFGGFRFAGLEQHFWQPFEIRYRLRRAGFHRVRMAKVHLTWEQFGCARDLGDEPPPWDWFFQAER